MSARSSHQLEDWIILNRARRPKTPLPQSQRRSYLWTLTGGILGSMILFWVMVQLGQASSDPKVKSTPNAGTPNKSAAAPLTTDPGIPVADAEGNEKSLTPPTPATQGPAIDTPREVIDMLDLRKRDLDRREAAIRQNEERLIIVRTEIEQLLAKNEALAKLMQSAGAKQDQQAKTALDKERQVQEQKNQRQAQLAKIYESMPPEEAAERLERMPDRKAIEILRLVKGKTAGAILAQVKVDRAAKLTEQLLAQSP